MLNLHNFISQQKKITKEREIENENENEKKFLTVKAVSSRKEKICFLFTKKLLQRRVL